MLVVTGLDLNRIQYGLIKLAVLWVQFQLLDIDKF